MQEAAVTRARRAAANIGANWDGVWAYKLSAGLD